MRHHKIATVLVGIGITLVLAGQLTFRWVNVEAKWTEQRGGIGLMSMEKCGAAGCEVVALDTTKVAKDARGFVNLGKGLFWGTIVLLATLVLLGVAVPLRKPQAKKIAVTALAMSAVAMVLAILYLRSRPEDRGQLSASVGWSAYVYMAGVLVAMLGAVEARTAAIQTREAYDRALGRDELGSGEGPELL